MNGDYPFSIIPYHDKRQVCDHPHEKILLNLFFDWLKIVLIILSSLGRKEV